MGIREPSPTLRKNKVIPLDHFTFDILLIIRLILRDTILLLV